MQKATSATSFGASLALKIFLLSLCLVFVCFAIFFALPHLSTTAQASDADTKYTLSYPVIVIDAGHGGEDSGTSSADGLREKDINLDISKKLASMLTASGIDVILTRNEDILLYDRNEDYQGRKKVLDLAARLKIARETENALFVSIHMNAFPISKYKGLQVYYSQNNPESYSLATLIQTTSRTLLDPSNTRAIKAAGSNIYLLDNMDIPSVLIECGFLSNPEESALFATDEHRQKVAFTIFCSIIKYIENCA